MSIANILNTCFSLLGLQLVRQVSLRALEDDARRYRRENPAAPGNGRPIAENDVRVEARDRFYATRHHSFRKILPRSIEVSSGFFPSFGGSVIRGEFFDLHTALSESKIYNISEPELNEEYWEWVDLLDAIYDADDEFVMAEIGAGYGRWIVSAACLGRHIRPSLRMRLIGVEAEPSHYKMMHTHFTDNGLDPSDHRLVEAAVNATGGTVSFSVGHPQAWYGQAIVNKGARFEAFPEAIDVSVPAITLPELLENEKRIDLIDMDIQGAEGEVIVSSLDTLNAKVRRLHIGTHSHEVEAAIFQALTDAGWHCTASFPCGKTTQTDFGPVEFQDGVQSWINPRLI